MQFEGFTIKEKGWIWKLTYPFAHANYTVIGSTIYCPNSFLPPIHVVRHEAIHKKQREAVGSFLFYLLYLFVFPIIWNPWRYKWEVEAYVKGSGISEERAKARVKSRMYGWLLNEK